jgi:ABC-type transport system involved in multi-copper enzyme maturation permease subunit
MIEGVYLSFLLPILCLCIGTQAVGGDWEERSLVWLLTRPLPRPLVYAAKFLAALPWAMALSLGGLFLLGLLAGRGGAVSAVRFWDAVALCTIAYTSLFVFMGAWLRRSTVMAVVYSFVVETIVGSMPGFVKRASIAFYGRSLVYAQDMPGVQPDNPALFMAVEAKTAVWALAIISVVFFLLGVVAFSRREYHDLTS